jgi:hypothetical protein
MGLEATVDQIELVNFAKQTIVVRTVLSEWTENRSHAIPPEIVRDFAKAMHDYLTSMGLDRQAAYVKAQIDHMTKEPSVSTEKTPASATVAEQAKTFAAEVAYRTSALQLTKRMRGLLADALTQHLKGKARAAKRKMLLDLLDGPMGGPLVALLLSGVLPQVASLIGQDGDKVARLAEELRLHAGVTVTSELVDGLFGLLGPARDALSQAMAGLPDVRALPEGGRRAVLDMETERAKVAVR